MSFFTPEQLAKLPLFTKEEQDKWLKDLSLAKQTIRQIRFSDAGYIVSDENLKIITLKTEVKQLIKENKRLKKRKRCVICKTEEVGITFLPCGHFTTCKECGTNEEIQDCSLCGKSILGTVRTFLS